LGAGHGRSAAAVRGAAASAGSPAATPTPAFKPGELIVKYKPAVRPAAAQLFARGRSFAAATGSTHLDDIHRRYAVKAIEPLFPLPQQSAAGSGFQAELATAAQWQKHVGAIRQRFPVRARRAPAHARLPDLSTVYKITVPADTDIKQLAAEYATDPSVEYAEPNYEYQLQLAPNDPFFSSSGSWGQNFADLWGLHNVDCEEAWDLSTGAGVTVAVLDTGIAGGPELGPNWWVNPAEIAGNGVDDDGNGYIDDVNGWNFFTGTANVLDFIGHGTHVSGTIAAVGNNGLGVIGVAWQAHIMTESIFTGLGETTAEWVAAALRYAADNGADVVNMSFGGYGDALLVRDTADYAAAHGVVLVAAAGNDAIEVPVSPASLEPVIAVAAVDHLDEPAWFSNSGGKIELAAPGGGDSRPPRYEPYASVLSVNEGGCPAPPYACVVDPQLLISSSAGGLQLQFLRLGGTSMAAPHVSGVAALILSRHPEFTVEQVRQALRNGADDLGPAGRDARYGSGRLNAARSVALDAVAVARLTAPKHLSRLHGELITVEGTVQNPGGGTPSWQLLFGPQGQTLSVIASGTGELDHQTLATLDTGPLDRGNYTFELDVTGPDGATASDNLTFTRLATRPYIRQLTTQTGQPWLTADAWSADGRTLVWSDMPHLASYRILATDLPTGAERPLAEFQYGFDNPRRSYPLIDTVISRDGGTVAFVARQDLSPSNFSEDPNFVLFLLDTASGTLQALTPPAGPDIDRLAIAADGSRLALVSDLGLDPRFTPNKYLQVFYWDRATNAFHQLTTLGQQDILGENVALTLDGQRLAFVSNADLDPSVGNAGRGWQVFTYDIASGAMHQLTTYPPSPVPAGGGTQEQLDRCVAFSPDGGTLAVAFETMTYVPTVPGVKIASVQQSILFIDVTSGTARPVVQLPPVAAGSDVYAHPSFSLDGTALFFEGWVPADPLFPPFAVTKDRHGGHYPNGGVFRYDIAAGTVEQLGPGGSTAAAPAGQVSFRTDFGASSRFTWMGLDPEGMNPDESAEIYLLDPDTAGGFLWLRRGRLRQRTTGGDSLALSGRFVQLAGALPDPMTNDVSVTVLSANGQIFHGTVPASSMHGGEGRWSYSNSSAPDLTHLRLSTKDSFHYTFTAAGRGTGLFSAGTPYITVEIQVGDAVFSNAQRFHYSGRRLAYP
jgi:subtilisin family serine protease